MAATHPVQVPRWPSSFAPGIKTKLKDFRGGGGGLKEINSPGLVDFSPRS